MMTAETKETLREKLAALLSEVESLSSEKDSLEWYLSNQIQRYVAALNLAATKQDVENATAMFSRFCTESMDWDSDMYKKCTKVTAIGFKLAKRVIE